MLQMLIGKASDNLLAVGQNSSASRTFLFSVLVALCLLGISLQCSLKRTQRQASSKTNRQHARTQLETGAVRVSTIRLVDAATFEANAEVATAFRLEQSAPGQWRVVEFRTGQDQWQSIEFIGQALKIEPAASSCDAPELAVATKRLRIRASGARAVC